MTRQRLTWREASMNKEADPNSLGRPDRKNPPVEDYMNYEYTTNHPYPDLRHQWKRDHRVETGHGAPVDYAEDNSKEASKKEASHLEKKAKLALKLAEILHPGAAEDVHLTQAANFMEMSDQSLVDTFRNVSLKEEPKVQEEEEMEEMEEKGDEKLEDLLEGGEEVADEMPADEAMGDEEGVDQEAIESVMKIVEDVNPSTLKELATLLVDQAGLELADEAGEELGEEDLAEGADEMAEGADEMAEGTEELEEGEELGDDFGEEEELFGIDLSPVANEIEAIPMEDEEVELDGSEQEVLAQLFEAPRYASVRDFAAHEGTKVTKKTASTKGRPAPSKKGVKALGGIRGQKKQASRANEVSKLSSLWKSDPDVTHIFE